MKAAQINKYGDSSVIEINEVDMPKIESGKVLIEVHASSLNPFDTGVRSGYMSQAIPLQMPVTLGGDIAGVVIEVGEGVKNVSVGDKIYGQANTVAGNSGAFAEYALTTANQVARIPSGLGFEQAGSLSLVGVSALQGIKDNIGLKSGQKILIHGGAGNIGAIAIQIAKNIGAYVSATAKSEDTDFVIQRGADEVIDYTKQDFVKILRDYDAVFDTVGGEDFTSSFKILKENGVAVSMIAPVDETKAKEAGIRALTQTTKVTTEALNELSKLVEDGVVTPKIGKKFSLEHIKEAFDARESGKVRGKVVIEIK